MAISIPFRGANTQFILDQVGPEDTHDTGLRTFFGFVTKCKVMTHTAWALSPEEIAQIVETGVVMVSFKNHGKPLYPMWVGSREFVLEHTLEFGGMWKGEAKTFTPAPPPNTSIDFDFRDHLSRPARVDSNTHKG